MDTAYHLPIMLTKPFEPEIEGVCSNSFLDITLKGNEVDKHLYCNEGILFHDEQEAERGLA
jgi:hypothetical protein